MLSKIRLQSILMTVNSLYLTWETDNSSQLLVVTESANAGTLFPLHASSQGFKTLGFATVFHFPVAVLKMCPTVSSWIIFYYIGIISFQHIHWDR